MLVFRVILFCKEVSCSFWHKTVIKAGSFGDTPVVISDPSVDFGQQTFVTDQTCDNNTSFDFCNAPIDLYKAGDDSSSDYRNVRKTVYRSSSGQEA